MTAPTRDRVAGVNARVPVLGGATLPDVKFDNAASTPPFQRVLDAVTEFAPWYSNVHRGTGFKSRLSTRAYDEARATVALGGRGRRARRRPVYAQRDRGIEPDRPASPGRARRRRPHHDDGAPFERPAVVARVVHVRVGQDGRLDEDDLRVLGEALCAVAAGRHERDYVLDPHRGEYLPAGYTERFTEYCSV